LLSITERDGFFIYKYNLAYLHLYTPYVVAKYSRVHKKIDLNVYVE